MDKYTDEAMVYNFLLFYIFPNNPGRFSCQHKTCAIAYFLDPLTSGPTFNEDSLLICLTCFLWQQRFCKMRHFSLSNNEINIFAHKIFLRDFYVLAQRTLYAQV